MRVRIKPFLVAPLLYLGSAALAPAFGDSDRSYVSIMLPGPMPVTLAPVSIKYCFPCALEAAPGIKRLGESCSLPCGSENEEHQKTYGCELSTASSLSESSMRHCSSDAPEL